MNNIAHKTRCYSLALFMTLTLTAHGQAKWNDYAIRDSVVTYQGQALPDADTKSFVELGFGYAKDQYNVYAHGEVLEFVDPATFQVDARFTRHHKIGTRLQAVQQKSSQPSEQAIKSSEKSTSDHELTDIIASMNADSSGQYIISADRVTYEGKTIKGADISTFEILKAGYARDRHHAYYHGQLIHNAIGGKNFRYTMDDYASDGVHTYFKGKEVSRD